MVSVEYTDPDDRAAAQRYRFARGCEFVVPVGQVEEVKALLPAGTEFVEEPDGVGHVNLKVATPVDVPEPVLKGERLVGHGRHVPQHPWPVGTAMSAGRSGVVLSKSGSYQTAFWEVYPLDPQTVIRGEGATVQEAEDNAWAQYQRIVDPGHEHEFETRGYRNGAGFCKHCGLFMVDVFTLEEIGSLCHVCQTPTYWVVDGDRLYCEEHAPSREDREHPLSPLEELFDALAD